MKHEVLVENVADLDAEAARERVLSRIDSLGWFDRLKDHIVIKPNLCVAASPSSGIVTDTLFVEGLIRWLQRKYPASRITIVESDAKDKVAAFRSAESVFERLGYYELREKYGVALHNLSRDAVYPLELPGLPYTFNVSEFFMDPAFSFISLAQLKLHDYEKITCTLKNNYGLLPDRDKEQFHIFLPEALHYLAKIARPDLCIVDGRIGMTETGPVSGKPRKVGLFIAGKDPGAVDTVCARIMGIDPNTPPHLRYYCKKEKLHEADIQVLGDAPALDFNFGPMWLYRTIRVKVAIKRLAKPAYQVLGKYIRRFFRLPSYVRERLQKSKGAAAG
jgi:uncharacterized protein (DUF362 family)